MVVTMEKWGKLQLEHRVLLSFVIAQRCLNFRFQIATLAATDIAKYWPTFYAPGLKRPQGASSNWIVCPSVCVCLFVHPSVCLSVIPSRLQTKSNN